MNTRIVGLAALWLVAIVYCGWLRVVVLVTIICGCAFFGTMFFFALYDAIRTRNDRETQRRPTPEGDEELSQLRQMTGLK